MGLYASLVSIRSPMSPHSAFAINRSAATRPACTRWPNESPQAHAQPNHKQQTCTFALISTRAGFNDLAADWSDLFDRTSSGNQVFQSFHWLWHWCNHFLDDAGANQSLAIVTGRRNGRLVLVWPLVVNRAARLKHLTWMGQPVSQYGDILHDETACDASDLMASWTFIKTQVNADVLHLRKVRADAAVAQLLCQVCTAPVARETAPFLDLSEAKDFEDYQQRYAGKARKNRRRLRRRVAERAPLCAETFVDGGTRSEIAHEAICLKRDWLKSRGLISRAIQDDRTRSFFKDAAGSINHATGCRTTQVKIGDQTAAIEVSFVSKGHCAVHVIVYALAFEKAGAGVLLMEDAIKSAISAGIKTFDLMAPGDSYKLDWADGYVNVEDWCTPLSVRGRAFHALGGDKMRAAIKSTLLALPLSIRRMLHSGFALTCAA